MSVVVRNETSKPWYFGSGSERKKLEVGAIDTITQSELAAVPFDKRGPGEIHVLYPNQASSSNPTVKLDYYVNSGITEVRYMGTSPYGVADSEELWIIRRFSHLVDGAELRVTEIQVQENVAWDDRATLPWV